MLSRKNTRSKPFDIHVSERRGHGGGREGGMEGGGKGREGGKAER